MSPGSCPVLMHALRILWANARLTAVLVLRAEHRCDCDEYEVLAASLAEGQMSTNPVH